MLAGGATRGFTYSDSGNVTLYDPGGALYAEADGAGNTLREYITLGGATVAIVDAGGMVFVHSDHLGAPQVMTDGSAAVVWDASYRPFGEATIAGFAANDQRFPGQYADTETGYYDNWHRTYDPRLGRYLQSDPIGILAGFNTYAYANNNPVMNVDPTGEIAAWIVAGGVGAAVGFGVNVGVQLAQNGGNLSAVNWGEAGIAAVAGGVFGVGTTFALFGQSFAGLAALGSAVNTGAYWASNGVSSTFEGTIGAALSGGLGALVGGKVPNPFSDFIPGPLTQSARYTGAFVGPKVLAMNALGALVSYFDFIGRAFAGERDNGYCDAAGSAVDAVSAGTNP